MEDGAGGGEEGVGADEDILANCIKSEKVTKFYPSERSELRYRVQGVPFPVGYPLSPPRVLHWEGFKA